MHQQIVFREYIEKCFIDHTCACPELEFSALLPEYLYEDGCLDLTLTSE